MLLYLFTLATHFWLSVVGARRQRLQVGDVSLVYYCLGPQHGEPWVLLHGLGSVAATWGEVLFRLRRDCRLIVPELSIFGGSKIPGGGLDVRNGVEVISALIEKEFGRRPVTVAGLSLGGWLAARLAMRRPDLVGRLVLVNSGGYREQDWDTIERLVRVEDMAGVDRLYGALFARTPWVMRLSRTGFLQAYTSPAVTGIIENISEEDTFDDDDLRQLRMPTALIWGEHDGLFRVECARAMAEALPDATLEVLKGCGHAIHLECPDRLADAMQRVRRAIAPRRASTFPEGTPTSVQGV